MRDDYRGRIEHQHTEAYQLVRWWGDEEFIKRSGTDVRRHPHGAYELLVPVTGSMMIRQADTALRLDPAAWRSPRSMRPWTCGTATTSRVLPW